MKNNSIIKMNLNLIAHILSQHIFRIFTPSHFPLVSICQLEEHPIYWRQIFLTHVPVKKDKKMFSLNVDRTRSIWSCKLQFASGKFPVNVFIFERDEKEVTPSGPNPLPAHTYTHTHTHTHTHTSSQVHIKSAKKYIKIRNSM